MIIPGYIRSKWKKLYINGDYTKMAKGDNSLRQYVTDAMNGKDCNEETFKVLRDFYKEREQLLKTA